MKTMTCKQLKGACEEKFKADSVEEMIKLSQEHGMAMWQSQDQLHMDVMNKMKTMGNDPKIQEQWLAETKELFDSLPDNEA
jgi:hypothetical protein